MQQQQYQPAPSVEDLGHGLFRTYYRAGRVVVYRLNTTNTESVTALVQHAIALLQTWPPTLAYRALVVVAGRINVDISEIERIAAPLLATRPELCGGSAYVLTGQLAESQIEAILQITVKKGARPARIFTSEKAAVNWLESLCQT